MTTGQDTTDPPIEIALSEDALTRHREHIVAFIRETVADAGAAGAVIGLSGGIDSTVTATLAVEALGAEAVRGLVMPGSVSSEENMSDAERVATDLGLEYDIIEIDLIVESLRQAVPEVRDDQVAVGNARARTRAVLNYLVANHEDRIVLGTGNKSEALVGYFTKYGDGAVDCHPIGNLYKTQVRQLAHRLDVPEDIITKPPTAGLWAGQTDEAELGVDYPTLDAILAMNVVGDVPPAETAATLGIAPDVVDSVRERHERSAHKRAVPPTPAPLD